MLIHVAQTINRLTDWSDKLIHYFMNISNKMKIHWVIKGQNLVFKQILTNSRFVKLNGCVRVKRSLSTILTLHFFVY